MKTLKKISFISAILVLFSCSSTQSITEVDAVEKMTQVEIPLSGPEYRSDKSHFRATQSGTSSSLSTAKKIALQNAKTELASNIQATIKSVTDQYINQRNFQNNEEFESKFEELSRTVVNQNLTNVRSIKDILYKTPEGKFQYWIAIECPKEEIFNKVAESITEDERLKIDFDKFQYQKIFDAEMEKFENSNN
jgi:hypothetical protein